MEIKSYFYALGELTILGSIKYVLCKEIILSLKISSSVFRFF